MRSSEQITVGALAIKDATGYGGFFDSFPCDEHMVIWLTDNGMKASMKILVTIQ